MNLVKIHGKESIEFNCKLTVANILNFTFKQGRSFMKPRISDPSSFRTNKRIVVVVVVVVVVV